jgi:hypothetical protein
MVSLIAKWSDGALIAPAPPLSLRGSLDETRGLVCNDGHHRPSIHVRDSELDLVRTVHASS